MANENEIYKIWVDTKTPVPTPRIEWKQTEDLLPKFIKSLEEWQQRKVYQIITNYIEANAATGDTLSNFYAEYNNEDGIEYIKGLIL